MPLHGEYEPSPRRWVREQVELFESSDGQQGNTMQGKPIIVITTLGATSGRLRKTPLMRVEHGGQYVAVGSNGGSKGHPAWVANVRAHPQVELQDGSARGDYVAEELSGPRRDEWWDRAVAAFRPYAGYQTKTARTIPLFLLTPAG